MHPQSGYRYYGTGQFEVLNTIRYLRALDMPLSEIESFIKNRDIDRIEEKLRQQKDIVVKKQQELQRIEQKIKHRLNWLEDAQRVPLDEITVVEVPARRIVWMRHLYSIAFIHRFYVVHSTHNIMLDCVGDMNLIVHRFLRLLISAIQSLGP